MAGQDELAPRAGTPASGPTRTDGSFLRVLPKAAAVVAVAATTWFALCAALELPRAGAFGGYLLTPLNWTLATVTCFVAARRTPDRIARRFWYQVATSCAICTAATIANTQGAVGLQRSAPPVVALMFELAVVILVYALLRLPIPRRPGGGWLTLALDLGIVAVAGGLLAWFLVELGAESMGTHPGSDWVLVALLGTAIGGAAAVTKVALGGTAAAHSGAVRILGGTAVIGAFLAGLAASVVHETGIEGGHLVMPLCAFGYVLAADRQRRASAGLVIERPRRSFSRLPYAAIALVDVLLIAAELTDGSDEALTVGSVALTALVVGRQLMAFRDNDRLVHRLDESLAEVRRHEHRFRSLLRHSSDIITVTNTDSRLLYASPGMESVLRRAPDELVGVSLLALTHPDDQAVVREHYRRLRNLPGTPLICQARLGRPDGSWRWLEIVSTNLLRDPEMRGIVSNARDITDTRRYQDELAYQASHDELTGLANRSVFARRTDAALAAGLPERTMVALVDLDDFKTINDRLGHTVGDALLRAVAHRLTSGIRPQDTVARLGGDEFAVLLRDVDPNQRDEHGRRIIEELSVPVSASGHDLLVRASIGIAAGTPGADAGELLRRADVAMYAAKGLGRGRCIEFDPAMDVRAREHARLAADLSMAVERGEIHLRYQPIVALPTGSLAGVEALVRWVHPVRGMVPPAEFIPVAERTGLIVQLGAWVLHEACRQAAEWLKAYGPHAPERMSVNVSARQLIDPDFPAAVESALLASGLPPHRLTVEITETAVFDGGPALEAVQAMRALGVRVALDDFGTGHSSLGLLRTCPIDVLKVDKSFVDGVAQSLEQEAIVTSVSQIGTAMRLQVVAEGVETALQADRLHTLGYRFAQGFHFARPMLADAIEAQLALALAAPPPPSPGAGAGAGAVAPAA